MESSLFIAMLVIYIVIGTIIALVSRRFGVKTTADYFVAGYRLGGFLASMTYAATTYSAFMMIGLVGLAYATGVAALGFELAYLIATLGLLATVGPIIWCRARERRWVSPSEMLAELYGSNVFGMIVAILYLVALIPYTAAQLKGIGEIFGSVGIGYEIGIVIGIALVLLWTVIGGIWSVATTDAYQGLWMVTASILTISWLTLALLPSNGIDVSRVVETLTATKSGNLLGNTWNLNVFLGFTTPWLFFALTNPQVVQRLYMPRNEKAYRRMVQYFALYGLLYTVIVVAIGLLFRAFVINVLGLDVDGYLVKHRDRVTPYMLSLAPLPLAMFVMVSIVAAAVSTANSIVLSVASSIARDFYEKRAASPNPSVARTISVLSIVAMCIAAASIAIARVAFIVELSVLSSALLLPLAPITIVGIYRNPGKKGLVYAYTALIVSCLTMFTAAVLFGAKKALVMTFLGIPLPLLTLALSLAILLPIMMARR